MTPDPNRSESSAINKATDMEAFEWTSILGATFVLFLFISLALIIAGGWDWFSVFLTSSASGWVQALGSVAAIWGAFFIANRQQTAQIAKENEETRQKRRQRLEACRAILNRAESLFNGTAGLIENRLSLELLRKETVHAEKMLDSLPLLEIPDPSLVHRFGLLGQSINHLILNFDYLEKNWDSAKAEAFALNAKEQSNECAVTSLYCWILIKACSTPEELRQRENEEPTLKTIKTFVEQKYNNLSSET